MLCSIANDRSGAVYKIISISWDGFSKECYLHKYCPEGESKPEDDKDVPERDLVPAAQPREIPRELTPPPSEHEWSPPCSDSDSDHGVPIRIDSCNGAGGPVAYPGDNENVHSTFSSLPNPRPAYVEESHDSDDDEDYQSRPPLSPAMAEKGMFPADEEYYSSRNGSYDGDNERYSNEDEFHDRDETAYNPGGQGFVALPPPQQANQGFVSLGPQQDQGFVSLGPQDNPGFVSLRQPRGYHSESEEPGSRSDRSDRSGKRSHGSNHKKKHKGSHREKSDKEKDGGKIKSKSKSRSRRDSTSSSEKEGKKEERKESNHRGKGQNRKPSLFSLPKF